MRTAWLGIRMGLCVLLLFAVIYALLIVIASRLGGTGSGMMIIYALLAFVVVAIQFFIGPKIVERSMRVRYVSEQEQPELHRMVTELAMKAGIPKPRVGISEISIPNAFAFGTSKKKARVCVTRRLMEMLKRDELEAVIGHELSHIKHRDMVVITALSVIPMICYFIYISFFWSGIFGGGRSREGGVSMMAIALIAFVVYFISNLIVLYASRVREYYADAGSAELTGKPHELASALYKMIYGSAGAKQEKVKKEMGSMRAFFAADPVTARRDLKDLRAADLNKDGKIDEYELRAFAERAKATRADRIMEIFSTHPTPVSRVKKLGEYL
uniref:Protease HtpX homolog n=1 Tax=Candidatus Methanophagaceae archaeon ANME-1 ERB6 TaxID=2759912 RepID=A0A7G9YYN8_9EURY|nr:protease HtpX [Methanosarcinales archaeon ANME-1 ERB6]